MKKVISKQYRQGDVLLLEIDQPTRTRPPSSPS